jgi:hypothetical protein
VVVREEQQVRQVRQDKAVVAVVVQASGVLLLRLAVQVVVAQVVLLEQVV